MKASDIVLKLGPVPQDGEHVRATIKQDDTWRPLARVAPTPAGPSEPAGKSFALEWLIPGTAAADRRLRREVRESLDFFVVHKGEPDPWAYFCYHCTTASNLYSGEAGGIYWEWFRPGSPT